MRLSIDEKIKAASGQLLAGRPQITDGRLTVANLCAEAGVSRASFYRSPHASAIRQALAGAGSGAPDATPRPETEELREQLRQLAKTQTARRSQHAAEVRALRATVTTYAKPDPAARPARQPAPRPQPAAAPGSPYLTGVPPIRPLRSACPEPAGRPYGALA